MVQNLIGCRVSFVALTLTRPIRHCLPSPQSVLPLNSYRNEFRPSQKWHAGYFVRRKREREETLFKTRFSPLTDSFSRPKPLHCQSSMKPHCLRRKWSREVPNSTPTGKTINEPCATQVIGNVRARAPHGMSIPQSNWARAPTYHAHIHLAPRVPLS